MNVPNSVKKGLAHALKRARTPARLNTLVELNKSLNALANAEERRAEIRRLMSVANTPGRAVRTAARQQTNNNNTYNFQRKKLQAINTRILAIQRRLDYLLPRLGRVIPTQYHIPIGFNLTRKFVKNWKTTEAKRILARRINRAALDPKTELGRRRLLREFKKLQNKN
jgi:hypothetical protein